MASMPDQPLDYYQPSPVRGQLEPPDPRTKPGTRWLQCTDTPGELRALLPPKTAQMYAQLLKAENIELLRGRGAIWKRIIEIRHLKDRMIRKCQRISRVSAPAPPGTPFRDLYAPNDFRLKEMEKWLKMEGFSVSTAEGNAKYTTETIRARSHSPHSTRSSSTHAQPAQVHAPAARSSRLGQVSRSSVSQRISTRASATVRRRSSASSQSTVQSPSPAHSRTSSGTQTHKHGAYQGPSSSARAAHLSPVVEEGSTITSSRLTNPHDASIEQRIEEPSTRPDVISPDPLPRLYRPPSTNLQTAPVDMPHPVTEMPIPRPVPPPEPHMASEGSEFSSIPPSLPSKGHYEPASYAEFQDALDEGPSRPTLPRRRSSLKQPDGRMGSGVSQKVVSWAMDRDWSDHMSKYDQIVYATEIAGNAWDDARNAFQKEIASIRVLRENITTALSSLQLETEKLQAQESTLRAQEEKLVVSFENLQQKGSNYKDTVHAVLEETKRVVMAADTKRDEILIPPQ